MPVEGTWRSHQVPIADFKTAEHVQQLEDWLASYRSRELFDDRACLREEIGRASCRERVYSSV